MEFILIFAGLLLLVAGAGWFVEGASSLADRLGVSKLLIGLTVVSLGTTLPELMVSTFASVRSSEFVVFGNIIGSCLANILLVLGIITFLTRLEVRNSTTWKEIPFVFLASLLLCLIAMRPLIDGSGDNQLSRTDGIVLLMFFAIFSCYVFEVARKNRAAQLERRIRRRSLSSIAFLLSAGGLCLYLGGGWTVRGAVALSAIFGSSELLVSATVVALGTSLPELATAVTAALKNQVDIAVGNVLGACILNVFWVLGLTSVISPLAFPACIRIDTVALAAASFALFIFMFTGKKHELDRWEGAVFLLGYAAYITFLIIRG